MMQRPLMIGLAAVGLAFAAGCGASPPSSAPAPTTAAPTTAAPTTGGPTSSEPSTTIAVPAPAPPPAPAATSPQGSLPNPALTPGQTFPGVTAAQICRRGWASSHRDVPEAERRGVFAAYGVPFTERDGYELDHLISLELGGDNAQANLWPEPHDRAGFPGSQTKDVVENRLHDLVCSGRLDLATAQHAIAANWQTVLGPSND